MTKIKICGLRRPVDIEMVNELKPDYCGFIINFPKSHRSVDEDTLRNLCSSLDKTNIIPVGVFVNEQAETVASLLNDGVIEIAQLHGNENEEYIKKLRKLTDKKIIKAFAVKDEESIINAAGCSADYVLLDQGQGSGEQFDWSLLTSDKVKESSAWQKISSGKWFLAGGLASGNVKEAIRLFRPYAVDLSSSVETDKVKDYEKVKEIIQIVRSAG